MIRGFYNHQTLFPVNAGHISPGQVTRPYWGRLGLALQTDSFGSSGIGCLLAEFPGQIITQPETIRSFFGWCFAGIPMIGYAVCALIMLLYNIEGSN